MFILPSNFNVITSLNNIRCGVNVLVPNTGVPRRLQDYLENVAVTRASESNITGVLIELTTNKFRHNDITAEQAHTLPRRTDYSYCMYRRINALVFKSDELEQNIPYRDYTYILNVVCAEVNGVAHMHWFAECLLDWMRYYELRFEVFANRIAFYRNDSLFIEVNRSEFLPLLIESSSRSSNKSSLMRYTM
jgi:hypothetical protein